MIAEAFAATFLTSKKPYAPLEVPIALILALVALSALCLALVTAFIVMSMPRRRNTNQQRHGMSSKPVSKNNWHERIEDIVNSHAEGMLTRQDALVSLARLTREFAGSNIGKDMSSSTLLDIRREPPIRGNDDGMTLLKMTIGALYPQEFAGEKNEETSDNASVEQAGAWVADLVEKWR